MILGKYIKTALIILLFDVSLIICSQKEKVKDEQTNLEHKDYSNYKNSSSVSKTFSSSRMLNNNNLTSQSNDILKIIISYTVDTNSPQSFFDTLTQVSCIGKNWKKILEDEDFKTNMIDKIVQVIRSINHKQPELLARFLHTIVNSNMSVLFKDKKFENAIMPNVYKFYDYETGNNVLFCSIEAGYYKLVELLIKFGFPCELTDDGKNNILHIAVHKGNFDIVKLIASHENNSKLCSKKNNSGYTPLETAKFKEYTEIENYLNKLLKE